MLLILFRKKYAHPDLVNNIKTKGPLEVSYPDTQAKCLKILLDGGTLVDKKNVRFKMVKGTIYYKVQGGKIWMISPHSFTNFRDFRKIKDEL